MQFNRNVVGGLVLAGVAVVLLAPSLLSKVVPLLFVAACPLSMVLMMRMMGGGRQQSAPSTPVRSASCTSSPTTKTGTQSCRRWRSTFSGSQ